MKTPYSLLLLWRDRNRFFPAVFAVSFSCLLIAMQYGLLFGNLAQLSVPVERSSADVWVGCANVPSLEVGHPIPEAWQGRLMQQPEVARVETYLYGVGFWKNPRVGSEVVCIIGTRLDDESLGAVAALTPDLRVKLTERGAVVVDEAELGRLGLSRVGDVGEVLGQQVRLVGTVRGHKSSGPPFVFCSQRTARGLLPMFRQAPNSCMYLLIRCHRSVDAPVLVERLRGEPYMSVLTSAEFAQRTQLYWISRTNVGIGMAWTAGLSLVVGLVITSQTLYAAVTASLREYAVLRALGVGQWRIAGLVLVQSFWIGIAGTALAVPVTYGVAALGAAIGVTALLPPWLMATSAVLTVGMGLLSGLVALRSLRLVEPITLLR